MRVAMVSEHASPLAVLGGVDAGGQNVHVAALAEALARRGLAVRVYTRRDSPALPRSVALAPGVEVVHVDAGPARELPKDELLPYMDAFAAELAADWAREPPDVVHAHFWMSGRAAIAAAAPLGVPLVQTFHALGLVKRRHQGDADTSPPGRIEEERRIMRAADAVVATCSDEVFELARQGADVGRVTVVPCGVDLAVFRPDVAPEPRPSGRARVLVLSRMVERKGIDDVVRALAELPAAELVVAGGPPREALADDPEAVRLARIAEELGVRARVSFRGRVPRAGVPALLRSAEVVACTPWYEPFGIVPLEAMACGVPVVASAVGGLVDSVVHGATGLHVPPRRPDALVRALRTLLEDAGLRRRLGEAGAARARARYGWDRVADSTLRVYARVAEGRRPARRQRELRP